MKKILMLFLMLLLCAIGATSALAAGVLVDDADILTPSQESELREKLSEISERQKCEVAIVTLKSIGSGDPEGYANNYFDSQGHGYGGENDGILLLLSLADRDWAIVANAFGDYAIDVAGQEYIMEDVLSYLKKDEFYEGFMEFADQCDVFFEQARHGDAPYGAGNLPSSMRENPWIHVLISLGIGIVIAFCITAIMKSALKTVRLQVKADDYVRPDSMNVSVSRENFLYKNVTRVKRQENTSSHSGGSGGGRSSSSGKF